MKRVYWNSFLVIIFFFVAIGGYFVGAHYKENQKQVKLEALYAKIANSFSNRVDILIEEKRNATLTIGLSLAEDKSLQKATQKCEDVHSKLTLFSQKLKETTDFQNVWIQLIDANGIVISRSWTEKKGDDLKKVRVDVSKMTMTPKVSTSISVGKYDLSFKAMVPFFDNNAHFIGYLEVITHFNSVAKKLKNEGVETVVFADKSYKKQIVYPFTKKFIGEYYVANTNASDKLLEYIQQLGIENVISYKEKYSVTQDEQYLRINYTLFGVDSKPLAYILMFHKMANIDKNAITHEGFFIDLMAVFLLTVVGFLLFSFAKKEQVAVDKGKENFKYVLLFFTLFVFVITLYYVSLNKYIISEQMEFLESYNENVAKDYHIISRKFEIIAETMFATTIDKSSVKELMKEAYTEKKNIAREKLYRLLKSKYDYYNDYDVRQLHFHLKNNESFLRFHRPKKYGDNLTDIRATVELVNSSHKKVKGFEEGRIYNGFRHVFPLSYMNKKQRQEHLGSVEISFNAHAVANEFVQTHDAKVAFLISKEVVNAKLFKSEKSNYIESEFENFYYDALIKEKFQKTFADTEVEKISKKDIEKINAEIKKGEIFTLSSKDGNSLFSIIPLRNAISQEVVGAFILEMDSRALKEDNELFLLMFSVGSVLILLTIIFIYREFALKIEFLNLSLQTREILDTQKSMIAITDGEEVLDVNKKFLNFFGYHSLESFKEEYRSLSELFIEHDNYIRMSQVPKGITWIEYLEKLPYKDRIILFESAQGERQSFMVTFSAYNGSDYIFTFTNISATVEEQFVLEKKVLHDKLTGAYNREFFELKSKEILSTTRASGRLLGIIFFDVDHFKSVNDTYGHGVGDYVLQELIQKVSASIRSNDYLIRWGGEEFVILLSNNSVDELESIAENLRSVIAKHNFEHIKRVTCSFGVTVSSDDESITTTLDRADKALYISKENGRNRVTKL